LDQSPTCEFTLYYKRKIKQDNKYCVATFLASACLRNVEGVHFWDVSAHEVDFNLNGR